MKLLGRMTTLVVLNKDEDTVSFVDTTDGSTIKKIETAYNPHEVLVVPHVNKTYVSCSLGNEVMIIDNDELEVVDTITHPKFDFPHGLATTPDGEKLYLAATYSEYIFVIDPETDEITNVIDSHQKWTHMISFSPDGAIAYIANMNSDNVSLIDTETEEFVDHIPVGGGPEGIAAHPNGEHLYVANQEDSSLYVMDVETFDVLYEREIGDLPVRCVFSPDGRYALIANRASGNLSIVDSQFELGNELDPHTIRSPNELFLHDSENELDTKIRPWEVKRISLGQAPGGIVFEEDGSYAYVANNFTNDVSVVNMETLKEERRFDVGVHPDGIDIMTG